MTTVKEYIKTLLKLAINNNPEVLKVIRNSKIKNNTDFEAKHPRDENGRFTDKDKANKNKEQYLSGENVYDNFIDIHKAFQEKEPPSWNGQSVQEALDYLGIKDGSGIKIKSPIEEISIYKSHMEHLIDENNAYRKKYLNQALRTIQAPNLIFKSGNYKNYLKIFSDEKNKIKPHLQIVKTKEDGNFYVTTMKPTKKQVKKIILEGQVIYDLSSMSSTKSTDTNIVTNSPTGFNPDVKIHEVSNDKWITIHPNGEDSKGRPLLLKDGESPKEAIERSYKSSTKLKESSSEHPETNTLRKLLISNPKDEHYSRLFDLAQRGRERGKLARLIACKRSVNRRSGTFIVSNQTGEVYKKASKCVSLKEATNRVFLGTAMFLFQSTLPRGERHIYIILSCRGIRCFNPRSREGSDLPKSFKNCLMTVSIHAPARGATCFYCNSKE